MRSREIPERKIKPALNGVGSEETREAAVKAIARLLYTPNKKEAQAIRDRQALLIGDVEIEYLIERLREILAANGNNAPDEGRVRYRGMVQEGRAEQSEGDAR